MIIYNKLWLNNKLLTDKLKIDLKLGNITLDEFKTIKAAHPNYFYQPGMVLRAGLFILTFILASFATGLISLPVYSTHLAENAGWPIILGIIYYFALEFLVKNNNYFHSGVDNAILYYSAGLLGGGFIWMISKMYLTAGESLLDALFICVLCSYLTLRFADVLTAAVACVTAFASVYFFCEMMGSIGVATMPFMMMAVAAGLYYIFTRLKHTDYAN
jgi:hypothetical protein